MASPSNLCPQGRQRLYFFIILECKQTCLCSFSRQCLAMGAFWITGQAGNAGEVRAQISMYTCLIMPPGIFLTYVLQSFSRMESCFPTRATNLLLPLLAFLLFLSYLLIPSFCSWDQASNKMPIPRSWSQSLDFGKSIPRHTAQRSKPMTNYQCP